jgi:hypothetical protein
MTISSGNQPTPFNGNRRCLISNVQFKMMKTRLFPLKLFHHRTFKLISTNQNFYISGNLINESFVMNYFKLRHKRN